MALSYTEVRMVDYEDFEKLVQDTYGRPDYEFDHEGYMSNGSIQYFSVPAQRLADYEAEEFETWLANKPSPTDLSALDQERLAIQLAFYDQEQPKWETDPEPFLEHSRRVGGSLFVTPEGTFRSRAEYEEHFLSLIVGQGRPSISTDCPLDALAQDLFEKGLIEAGSYAVEKSW